VPQVRVRSVNANLGCGTVERTRRVGDEIRFWVPHSFAFFAKGWEPASKQLRYEDLHTGAVKQ